MKCQICNQREANIVFTKIVNNEKTVLHICLECANKKGLTIEIGQPSIEDAGHDTHISNQLGDINVENIYPDIICDSCGTQFVDFKKTGLYGCDRCHEVFGVHIDDILKQIHGSAVHEGKTPSKLHHDAELKKHLRTLRLRLKRCIESEEYERAAELRDKISALEGAIPENDI